jgi:hypothetical protein
LVSYPEDAVGVECLPHELDHKQRPVRTNAVSFSSDTVHRHFKSLLRRSVTSPNGAAKDSPGQRPGKRRPMDDGALKGRPNHGRFGRPFRALTTNGSQPRALPCSLPIKLSGRNWGARVLLLRTPTGFRPIAQGCAPRATLGNDRFNLSTPTGLCPDERRGLLKKPNEMGLTRGVRCEVELKPRGHNPVGVDHSMAFPG